MDYDAIVDGTNGDTILERVDGALGASHITAKGEIVRVEGVKRPPHHARHDDDRAAGSKTSSS